MHERNLDLLIDSAIRTYADPGPDSGLGQRVLARLSSDHVANQISGVPRRRWPLWAFGLAAAACLLILAFALMKTAHTPSNTSEQAHGAQQPPILTTDTPKLPALLPASPRRATAQLANSQARGLAQALPKLDVFPTPQPLTPEEQALAAIVAQAPPTEIAALIQSQQADAPLAIPMLQTLSIDSSDQDETAPDPGGK